MIVALLLAAALCPSPDPWPLDPAAGRCPQVYRIHGTAEPDEALNLVILSSGFTATELDRFRCATGLMVESLMRLEPFRSYACSINAYRIDIASEHSGMRVPERCAAAECDHALPEWPDREAHCAAFAGDSALPVPALGVPTLTESERSADCLEIDLGLSACPQQSQECRVVWPQGNGLRKIWRIAACAPAFDVVIVIVNADTHAGGGTEDMFPPLAVTTLNGIQSASDRANLLSHELGHALGLLDEYASSMAEGADLPVFHAGRNVADSVTSAPWVSLCDDGECRVVCNSVCEDCEGEPGGPDQPGVGLFQGGFYRTCDRYHAASVCTMRQSSAGYLCPACRDYLKSLFDDVGMKICPTGASPIPVPAGSAPGRRNPQAAAPRPRPTFRP